VVLVALAVWFEGFEAGLLANIVFALLPIITGKAVDDEAVRRSRIDRDGEAAVECPGLGALTLLPLTSPPSAIANFFGSMAL
jgi:hypothetical protein